MILIAVKNVEDIITYYQLSKILHRYYSSVLVLKLKHNYYIANVVLLSKFCLSFYAKARQSINAVMVAVLETSRLVRSPTAPPVKLIGD